MKTIFLAALALFALSRNVMADDSGASTTKDSTMNVDNGDGTTTTTRKHMKKGHGKKMSKKTETTSDTPPTDPAAGSTK